MKWLTKIAPGLLVLGLVLMLVGFGMAGFSMENLNTDGPYEQKTFESAEVLTALTVNSANDGVVVRRATDGVVRVVYYEGEKEGYDVGVDASGALSVRYHSDKKWYEYIGINIRSASYRIEVFLPEGEAIPVDISTTNGALAVSDLAATDLAISTVNGSVTATDITADRIEARLTSGGMALTNVTARTHLTASNVNGSINLTDLAAGEIDARTTSGSVILERVDARDAVYRSTNGRISGTVAGRAPDYAVSVRILNGTTNLTAGGTGARKLDASTTNGDIVIDFAG